MNRALKKKFREAAVEYTKDYKFPNSCYSKEREKGFLAGAEIGYIEGVCQAHKWLKEHSYWSEAFGVTHNLLYNEVYYEK